MSSEPHGMNGERVPRCRRSRFPSGAWPSLLVAVLAACADGGEHQFSPARLADSAGVAIVTNPPGEAVYATVASEPFLSLGAIDGPEELLFARIASVAVDRAGNLVVADGQVGEIRIFDAGGAHLRTLGATGEGPGEFQALAGAWPTAEGGIVAVDSRLDRITRFGPDGELLATATFEGLGEQPMIRPVRMAGPGTFLSRVQSLTLPSPTGVFSLEEAIESMSDPLGSRSEYVVRHDLTGVLIDTVATVPAQASVTSGRGGGTNMSITIMRVPFSPAPAATASPEGRMAVTAGRSYEFSVYDASGTLERIVRIAQEPPARTAAHLEAWVRASTGDRGPMDNAEVEAALRRYHEMPLPDRLPAWSALVIAESGEVWARRFAIRGAETASRDVFGVDGGYLGRVTAPANLRIQHVGDGRLTVISTDDLGVERVEVYEIR